MESNIERLLNALINGESIDIDPQTNVEHFLKECVDEVCCGHCPEPKSRMDILLIELRDKLINGSGSGKTEQEKSVNITSNGTTEVLPDENKTLSKVTVNTNVVATSKLPQIIDRSITALTAEDLAGTTKIGDYAFYYCRSLINVEIPNSVTYIGSSAFGYCIKLLNITIPNSVTYIGSSAFKSCNQLLNITFPNSVTSIGAYAFDGCKGLTNVVLSNSITILINACFRACTSLTTIVLPNLITEIESYVFNGCSSLISLVIPENVIEIGTAALRIGSDTNKATIIMKPTTPPSIQSQTFESTYLNKIIVPTGCGDAYKSATNWASYADYIEEEGA